MRILVFSDLDGTLLDRDSYAWRGARPALTELRRRHIPLILCTSKTRAEVQRVRARLRNRDPYAVENGGIVVVPKGYFGTSLVRDGNQRDLILRLGRPYKEVVTMLRALARAEGLAVRGFHQMTAAELARETGLSVADARLARRRESSEPFQILDASHRQIRGFVLRARAKGFAVQQGGRFWHLSAGANKGSALRILTSAYRIGWGTAVRVVALGDAANDLSMLQSADLPILLASVQGQFDPVVTKALPNIRQVAPTSPATWSRAVLEAVRECESTNGVDNVRRGPDSAAGH